MSAPLPQGGPSAPAAGQSAPGSSGQPELVVSSSAHRPSFATVVAIMTSRIQWQSRSQSWDERGSAGLTSVWREVVARCGHMPGGVAVDLGCGSGQVTLSLARRYGHVLGVDISADAIELLAEHADEQAVTNVQAVVHPLETLDLPTGSVDLVVSNYALHHLRDSDKRRLIWRAYGWLRPGGRLVIGDIMLGRGLNPADREIIGGKLRALARRGPSGWWRIAKNCFRFTLRIQEKPLPQSRWESLLRDAGFVGVAAKRVVAEACVISATKPPIIDGVRGPKLATVEAVSEPTPTSRPLHLADAGGRE
jgi:SAM-dependent methyltransferase